MASSGQALFPMDVIYYGIDGCLGEERGTQGGPANAAGYLKDAFVR